MESLKGSFYLFLAFTFAGSSVVSARIVSDTLGVFTITALSLAFAFLFLLPICRKKLLDAVRGMAMGNILMMVLQALFGIFLFRILLINGLTLTSASEAGLLTGATPAITVILAALFLREPVNKRSLMGITSTVTGILLIHGLLGSDRLLQTGHLTGNLLVLGAAACESLFNVISRTAAIKGAFQGRPVDPIVQTTLVSFIALILCIVPAMLEEPLQGVLGMGVKEWLALVWYGVFVTALAFICWYAGIKRCPASAAAAFSGMMPFTSLILSVLMLGEKAGWHEWAGGMLVIFGMILIGLPRSKLRPSC